jgi:hypothetical protein
MNAPIKQAADHREQLRRCRAIGTLRLSAVRGQLVLLFGGSLPSFWISYGSLFQAWPLLLLNLRETMSVN